MKRNEIYTTGEVVEFNQKVWEEFKSIARHKLEVPAGEYLYTISRMELTDAHKKRFRWIDEDEKLCRGIFTDINKLKVKDSSWMEPSELLPFPWWGWWYEAIVDIKKYVKVDFTYREVQKKTIHAEFFKSGQGALFIPRGLDWKPERVVCGGTVVEKMNSAKLFKRLREEGIL